MKSTPVNCPARQLGQRMQTDYRLRHLSTVRNYASQLPKDVLVLSKVLMKEKPSMSRLASSSRRVSVGMRFPFAGLAAAQRFSAIRKPGGCRRHREKPGPSKIISTAAKLLPCKMFTKEVRRSSGSTETNDEGRGTHRKTKIVLLCSSTQGP